MTMADTIAVMNNGRVEQQGAPAQLYETPRTAFVANFLGQSNMLKAELTGRTGDDLLLDVHGARLALPRSRAAAEGAQLLIGVRPEKIRISAVGAAATGNRLEGGIVTDASFTGVSTQYLVRMPWDQEMMVFAQNVDSEGIRSPGDRVTLSWEPAHSFALDGGENVSAGVETLDTPDPDPVTVP